jgi:glycosyltransferase involved in cell wall biosynthesis
MESKVSIIIPVYNVEKFLSVCIESVINQTYKNIEILLVNDGSTDSSNNICLDYKNKDSRIQLINQQNQGLSGARNTGIQNATGEYICFLDSDDWIALETIEKSLSIAISSNSDIVFWDFIKRFDNFNINYRFLDIVNSFQVFSGNDLENLKRRICGLVGNELRMPTKTDAIISAWGKLYKTKLIIENQIQFLPTQVVGSEDAPFNIESFFYSKRVTYIKEYYNNYRMNNDNSLTKHHKNTLFPRFKNLYNYVRNFLEKNDVSQVFYEALDNRFALSFINNTLTLTGKNYNVSFYQKRKDLNLILNDDLFDKCLHQLKLKFLPIHWKFFFLLAKMKCSSLILIFTIIYRKLIHK